MRVAFVYANPRDESFLRRASAGEAPDTGLWGQNHLSELGFDAAIRDSALRRRHLTPGLRHRVTWHARELVLPFELRDVDVVVTPLSKVLPLTARVARGPKILVVSYHLVTTFERTGPAKRAVLRKSLAAAAGVLTISAASRERLIEHGRLPPEKVFVAHLGVDERWWQPLPLPENGHLLAVGRDLARDYATLARAVAGLDLKTVIVAKAENLRGISLPDNVEVRSNISQPELLAAYAGASCVVVPMVGADDPRGSENSGTTALLEGMASARPTVVTRRPYLDDYVDPAATSTVDPGDADELRNAITSILTDAERQRSMGLAGRALVEERFTTRLFARRLASVIEAIL
jgi:glycosyltransferase involved in cell wall biosynthesis